MDSSDAITVIRLAVAVIVMSYASVLDWRTRKIGNVYWIGLSVLGLLLIPIQLLIDDQPLEYLLVGIPVLAVLADVYWDAGKDMDSARLAPIVKYAIVVVSVILLGYVWISRPYFQHLLAVPVMMLFIVIMYFLDIVRGGADAKALIALSILFPFYPAIGQLPLLEADSGTTEIVFPFSFIILVTAAVIVAFSPIAFATKNLLAHEFRFPQGLFGYKMNVEGLRGSHVWLMERMEAGKLKTYVRPRAGEDLDKEGAMLKEAGVRRIWVTPKIPFIIPMLAALVFSAIVGNFLLLFLQG